LGKPRLLVIDVLKIAGIVLIVLQHEWTTHAIPLLDQVYFSVNVWGVWQFEFGTIGVFLFLFASGLSLTYSHPQFSSWGDLKSFYGKRLLRIYPAYWIFGVGFFVCVFPQFLNQAFDWVDVVKIVSGFQAFGGLGSFAVHNIKRGHYVFENVSNLYGVIHKNETPSWYNRPFENLSEFWKTRWCVPRSQRTQKWKQFSSDEYFNATKNLLSSL
jgi:peptidoglycan/LPS O-acetylase OafA/YrhL